MTSPEAISVEQELGVNMLFEFRLHIRSQTTQPRFLVVLLHWLMRFRREKVYVKTLETEGTLSQIRMTWLGVKTRKQGRRRRGRARGGREVAGVGLEVEKLAKADSNSY